MKTNLLKTVFLMAAVLFLGNQLKAEETFEIKGKIVNSCKEGACSATVTLLDANTMLIVAEKTCDGKGAFAFENVEKGDYIISVSKPGYKKTDTRHIAINKKGKLTENNYIAKNK